MPAKERLRADKEGRPARAREHPAQGSHEHPVAAAKAWPGRLALQHRELMAKDHDLDVVVQVV